MNERVTIELDAEVLKRAREAGVDLSLVLKKAVDRELHLRRSDEQRKAEADRWYQEHKEEVDSYNEFIAENGLFSDDLRKF